MVAGKKGCGTLCDLSFAMNFRKFYLLYRNIEMSVSPPSSPPASADALLVQARAQFDDLSRQLKLIARYVEAQRDRIGLDGIQDTAARCGVQPSAIVRFAKRFGLSGFSDMQALFRREAEQKLAAGNTAPCDYQARIRTLAASQPLAAAQIPHELIRASVTSLQTLQTSLDTTRFQAAVDLMMQAKSLWLAAARRSFPVGAYLAYALPQTDKPVHWLNGLGHMQQAALRAITADDVLIAVSFDPYAQETLAVVQTARTRGAKLIAITDSTFSPLAKEAAVTLLAQDSALYGFRSLTSSLCLAQALFIGLAYQIASEQTSTATTP